jgi:cyclopropane-fatty-acyl-phospholipid synthase
MTTTQTRPTKASRWSVASERGLTRVRPSPSAFARALRTAVGVGAVDKAPALILEPQMAYSSGYFRSGDPSYTLEDAQRDKLDLVCTKLGLERGMRFLDIGCGWTSMFFPLPPNRAG